MAKWDIVCQIKKGAESKTAKEIKNKWALKNNFEETIEYLANLEVDDWFNVGHATVTNFYIVSVEYSVEFLVSRKVFQCL